MNKKGFTLVELIGVVVILGLIALVAFPALLNQIDSSKKQISDSQKEIIISAAKSYVDENKNDYADKSTFEIPVNDLIKNNYLSKGIISSFSDNEVIVTFNNGTYDVVIKTS